MLYITHKMEAEAELLDVGETARLDHDDCGAGEDTRRRLYLTRPYNAPDIVLCYCHNCQDSAVIRGKRQSWRGTWSDTKPPSGQEFEKPKSMNSDYYDWPPAAQSWFMQYSVPHALAEKYGVRYAPTYDRLYLPIHEAYDMAPGNPLGPSKAYLGYQLRSLDKLNSPKYLTAVVDDGQSYCTRLFDSSVNVPEYIVIVEDLMSAFKIWQARLDHRAELETFDILINYGIKLNLDALNENRDAAKGYIIWLDNDGVNVSERANEIARSWQLITRQPAWVVHGYEDPKKYTSAAIKQILTDTISGHD